MSFKATSIQGRHGRSLGYLLKSQAFRAARDAHLNSCYRRVHPGQDRQGCSLEYLLKSCQLSADKGAHLDMC